MASLADLRPGDIGFGPLAGGWGKLGMWGELIVDGGFHVGSLNVGHVFVVTEVIPYATIRADVWAVEAMPNGAREVHIGQERWTDQYAYARLPEDYPWQGEDAAAVARAMIGTPYSPLSYAALAAWRFGMKTPRLEAWIGRTRQGIMPPGLPREAICSVLADQSWALTGKQVMPKGTPHQCVTPSGLAAHLLNGMPGVEWIWPA